MPVIKYKVDSLVKTRFEGSSSDLAHLSATVRWGSIGNRDCILYPGVGTFVLIRPAQTFCERIKVELADSQRSYLLEVARRGRSSARKVKRALVLLKADEGLADHEVASGLLVSTSTVGRIRRRFVEEGVESALNERARPGQSGSWTENRKPT